MINDLYVGSALGVICNTEENVKKFTSYVNVFIPSSNIHVALILCLALSEIVSTFLGVQPMGKPNMFYF